MAVQWKHLSCGYGVPLGVRLFPRRFKGFMECHCVFVASGERRILVDSGLSLVELANPRRLGPFARALGLRADPNRAAVSQLSQLGWEADDITDIVLTHLDLDHAGGLVDFPDATVHVHERELAAAQRRGSFGERLRYRREQWRHARWCAHASTETMDLSSGGGNAAILRDGALSISLLPLFGHTRGHCGVLIETPERAVFHSGDTYYDASELEVEPSFLFRRFLASIHVEPGRARDSLLRLRRWQQGHPDVRFVSSHDPAEFAVAAVDRPDEAQHSLDG